MRKLFGIAIVVLVSGLASRGQAADPPGWAYGFPPAGTPAPVAAAPAAPAPPDTSVKHLTGSEGAYTRAQINDQFGPADWYPGDHPAMPDAIMPV